MAYSQEITQSLEVGGAERRTEPRVNVPGAVTISVDHSQGEAEFHAVLVDSSRRGLCIRHWHRDLKCGQQLRVTSSSGDSQAEVVWNWEVGPVVMSGLRLLSGPQPLILEFSSHSTPHKWGWTRMTSPSLILAGLAALVAVISCYFYFFE